MESPFGSTGEASEGDESSGSGGSTGRGQRGNIHIKGRFGTETFPPDTECDRCGMRAIGVLIKDNEAIPLCGRHRDRFKDSSPRSWDENEFRRFVDD